MVAGLDLLSYEERLANPGLFSVEKTNSGSYQGLSRYQGWVSKGWDQIPLSGAQQQDKVQWAQTGTQEVPSERKEKLL